MEGKIRWERQGVEWQGVRKARVMIEDGAGGRERADEGEDWWWDEGG